MRSPLWRSWLRALLPPAVPQDDGCAPREATLLVRPLEERIVLDASGVDMQNTDPTNLEISPLAEVPEVVDRVVEEGHEAAQERPVALRGVERHVDELERSARDRDDERPLAAGDEHVDVVVRLQQAARLLGEISRFRFNYSAYDRARCSGRGHSAL